MTFEVIKQKTATAPKILLYSTAGVGKSTLASQMPKPIFFDTEGGLNNMDVPRTPLITTIDDFYARILDFAKIPFGEYKTIVIDSVDWLVKMAADKIAGVGYDDNGNKITGFVSLEKTLNRNLMDANGGYGKAKEELENHVCSKFLLALNKLNQMGYGIVLIAHAYSNEILDEDGATTIKVMPKIDPPTIGKKPIAAPKLIEWVDNVFYLKKVAGERILQVEADNFAVAKNRLGLSGEYNLSEKSITEILNLEKEK